MKKHLNLNLNIVVIVEKTVIKEEILTFEGLNMERYHLDDLGWYQFEFLVQSLLKIRCGLSVESWGKYGDFGKDAFSQNPLKFPLDTENSMPFIFQVKFVKNAGATGVGGGPQIETVLRQRA